MIAISKCLPILCLSIFLLEAPLLKALVGTVDGSNGKPIVIQDLWALTTGSGPVDNPTAIYFTAGLQDEKHGLFGLLSANPEMQHTAMAPHGMHSMHG